MYSDSQALANNLSNAGIPTVKKITDLYSIKASGFYYYDAGATNAPMSSRGGMVIANYLSDSWISLNVVPYALSKIYTNTKYNNTWVGWIESATKDDLSNYWSLIPSISISEKADMNNFMTPGNYSCDANTTAKTLSNCPVTQAFLMKVYYPIKGGNYIIQEYTPIDGGLIIRRVYDGYSKTWTVKKITFS